MLLRTGGDVPVVSDEMRTLERVSPSSVWGLWASAAAGFRGLVYLLVVGATRGVLALVIAGMQRVRAGVGPMGARLDFAAILGLLQWCGVLAAWGLVPLVMWR